MKFGLVPQYTLTNNNLVSTKKIAQLLSDNNKILFYFFCVEKEHSYTIKKAKRLMKF